MKLRSRTFVQHLFIEKLLSHLLWHAAETLYPLDYTRGS